MAESLSREASGKPLVKCEKRVCMCVLQTYYHPDYFSAPTDLNVSGQAQPYLCIEAAISLF